MEKLPWRTQSHLNNSVTTMTLWAKKIYYFQHIYNNFHITDLN